MSVALIDANRKIECVNNSFCELFGQEGNKILGSDLTDILEGVEVESQVVKALNAAMEKSDPVQFETTTNFLKDGSRGKLQLNLSPSLGGTQYRNKFFLFCHSVSETSKRPTPPEQMLNLIQQSKMAVLGEMAGDIVHEINTPLTVTKLLLSQLSDEARSRFLDVTESVPQLIRIENAVDKIITIVKGVQRYIRDGSLDPMEFSSVRSIVDDSVLICAERLKQGEILLRLVFPEEDVQLKCRPTQISQVLLNLLSNAIDAVKTIEERWIEVKVLVQSEGLEFRVTDSGEGIGEKDKDKIFHPFFTTKNIGLGTGLGLSISREIIRNHGGELYFDHKSANTSFVFYIPGNI